MNRRGKPGRTRTTPREIPRILAHRGFSSRAPENTLSAFRLAAEHGVFAVELDVHLCASGQIVVIHDHNLKRTTGCDLVVEKASYDEILQCDAGLLFDRRFKGEKVPLLVQVLDELDERTFFDIEIKWSPGAGDSLERMLVREIRQRGLYERCIVSSFNPASIRKVSALDPEIGTALIFGGPKNLFAALARRQAQAASRCTLLKPHHRLVDSAYVKRFRQRLGYPILTWTVDDPAEARRVAVAGVDAVITNDPVAVRDSLQPQTR